MGYYLGSETEGLVVFKKSEAEHCILPPFSVVVESEEELRKALSFFCLYHVRVLPITNGIFLIFSKKSAYNL